MITVKLIGMVSTVLLLQTTVPLLGDDSGFCKHRLQTSPPTSSRGGNVHFLRRIKPIVTKGTVAAVATSACRDGTELTVCV